MQQRTLKLSVKGSAVIGSSRFLSAGRRRAVFVKTLAERLVRFAHLRAWALRCA